ncbi:MAG: hypothetical protein N2234_01435 [Planctomycetota bacterium]|nr:hypothetical protein [Planctomycetota bacterium]
MNRFRISTYTVFITEKFAHLADKLVSIAQRLSEIKEKNKVDEIEEVRILRDSYSTFAAVFKAFGLTLHLKLSKPRSIAYILRHLPPRYGRILYNFKIASSIEKLNLPSLTPVAALFKRRFLTLQESILITLFVEGTPLSELLRKEALPDSFVLSLAHSVATFHNASVFHGDLKPPNIIITPEDSVILCDYDNTKLIRNLSLKKAAKDLKRLKESLPLDSFKKFLAEYIKIRNFTQQDKLILTNLLGLH